MNVLELIRYTGRLLRGRRTVTALVCFLPVAAELFFRAAEACVYTMMIYFGGIEPLELFSADNFIPPLITVGFTAVRWTAAAPLSYITAYRLCAVCKGSPDTPLTAALDGNGRIRRSIAALMWSKLIGLLALVPAVFFGITAYSLFTAGGGAREMFLTVHAAVLTVISVGIWLTVKLSLSAVPFMLARYPGDTALRAVIRTLRFMSGRWTVLLKLMLIYLPEALTVIGTPFAIARIKTAFALSIDIYIKEDEYLEGADTDRRHQRSRKPAKLSRRAKGRIKASPDEAQALRERHNAARRGHTQH